MRKLHRRSLLVVALLIASGVFVLSRGDGATGPSQRAPRGLSATSLLDAQRQPVAPTTNLEPIRIPRPVLPAGTGLVARVLDDRHRPLAGIDVELTLSTSAGEHVLDIERSDETGHVSFHGCDMAQGTQYSVCAVGPGWTSSRAAALLGRKAVLPCSRAAQVHVAAVVGGERVGARLSLEELAAAPNAVPYVSQAQVDPVDGVLLWLPPGNAYRLFARTPTHASRVTTLKVQGGTRNEVALELLDKTSSARIEAHGSGKPVAGGTCFLMGQQVSSGSSDGDGMTSVFASIVEDLRDVVVRRHGDYLPIRLESCDTDKSPIRLRVPQEGASLRRVAVVVQDLTGRPLEGARIGWYGMVGTVGLAQVVTGRDGRAVGATSLSPRFDRALVYAEGYAAEFLSLEPGDHVLAMREIAPVQVKVVDRTGQAVPFAAINARPKDAKHPMIGIWTMVNVAGIAPLSCDGSWALRARRLQGDRWSEPVELATPTTTVVVPEEATAETPIDIVLVGAQGKAVRGTLTLQVVGRSGESREIKTRNSIARALGQWGEAVTIDVLGAAGEVVGHYSGPVTPHITVTLGSIYHALIHIHVLGGETTRARWNLRLRPAASERWLPPVTATGMKPRIRLPAPGRWIVQASDGRLVGETEVSLPDRGPREIVADLTVRASGRVTLLLPESLRGRRVLLETRAREPGDSTGFKNDKAWTVSTRRCGRSNQLEVADLEPGLYQFFAMGEAEDGQVWVAARTQVQVSSGNSVTVAAWSSRARFLTVGELGIAVGSKYAPAGEGTWLLGTKTLRVRQDSSGRATILVWPGDFIVYDRSGVPRYRIRVRDDYTTSVHDESE